MLDVPAREGVRVSFRVCVLGSTAKAVDVALMRLAAA